MSITRIPTHTVWACEDCLMAAAGYTPEELGRTPELEPWSRLDAGESVTPGIGWDEHEDGCGNRIAGGTVECGCEVREFSWSPCDGCGSAFGGSRHAHTVWS